MAASTARRTPLLTRTGRQVGGVGGVAGLGGNNGAAGLADEQGTAGLDQQPPSLQRIEHRPGTWIAGNGQRFDPAPDVVE